MTLLLVDSTINMAYFEIKTLRIVCLLLTLPETCVINVALVYIV